MPHWSFAAMNDAESTTGMENDRQLLLKQFMERAGLSLSDYTLLDTALTHASYLAGREEQGIRHYESLEFLGDAVLGLAVAHYLFETLPGQAPGDYTKLRATVVNKNTVARVAGKLNIAPMIRLGKGEESIGGRRRNALLADSLEAVIGAVYLSVGWNASYEFIVGAFHEELSNVCSTPPAWDYKSMLQNYCQAQRYGLPRFEVISSTGPDHRKQFEVEVYINDESCGIGKGASKKQAEQNAAYQALKRHKVLE
ncbi:MAG TPA: ribonuclease III [Candidatus Hydrogenedentes bacterium]|nr:ribonuclease III [Candidatus Hydrogenedentota bacterium]